MTFALNLVKKSCPSMATRVRFKNFFGKIDQKLVTKNEMDKIVRYGLFFTIHSSRAKNKRNKQKIN